MQFIGIKPDKYYQPLNLAREQPVELFVQNQCYLGTLSAPPLLKFTRVLIKEMRVH